MVGGLVGALAIWIGGVLVTGNVADGTPWAFVPLAAIVGFAGALVFLWPFRDEFRRTPP